MLQPKIRIQHVKNSSGPGYYRLSYRRGQMHYGRFETRQAAAAFRSLIGEVYSHQDITDSCKRIEAGQ